MYLVFWGTLLVLSIGLTVWARRRNRRTYARLAEAGLHDTDGGSLNAAPHLRSNPSIEIAGHVHPPHVGGMQ